MPIEEGIRPDISSRFNTAFFSQAFLILFLVFYTIFALILFRQIQLMGKTLPSAINPFLKFVAILHVGVSLALLLIVLGVF